MPSAPDSHADDAGVTPVETFTTHERSLIERALVSSGGNNAGAARQLGIARKKHYAKIAKYAM